MDINSVARILEERDVDYSFISRCSIIATFRIDFDFSVLPYIPENTRISSDLSYFELDLVYTQKTDNVWMLRLNMLTDNSFRIDNRYTVGKFIKAVKNNKFTIFDTVSLCEEDNFDETMIYEIIVKYIAQIKSLERYLKKLNKMLKIMNIGKED